MAAGAAILRQVPGGANGRTRQQLMILLHQGIPLGQQFLIPVQLGQANGGHDVRHVALVKRRHNVIFPRAGLGLSQGILVLAVKAQQHIATIERRIIQTQIPAPGHCAALCGGEILHRMERKGGEIRPCTAADAAADRTEAVRAIRDHRDPPQLRLQRRCR